MLLSFLLVVLGFSGLVLQMVGASWVVLQFLDIPGRLFSFVAKIVMVLAGVVLAVLANTNWERERRDSLEEEN